MGVSGTKSSSKATPARSVPTKATAGANPVRNISLELRDDPIKFAKALWPSVEFYREQRQLIYSVRDNDETFVAAGNMLGKDFAAGFILLWFFLTRHPVRIVTTSAKDDHLRVLWGEVGRFIQSSRYPLDSRQGGPLIVRHQELKKFVPLSSLADGPIVDITGDGKGSVRRCPISYAIGLVANQDSIAAMQGHHVAVTGDGIPRTLFMSDESSSVADEYYSKAKTWSQRAYIFGNTWPCTNFFYRAIEGDPATGQPGGDIPRPVPKGAPAGSKGYYRKVIQITAEHSPNVRLGLAERALGRDPSYRVVLPGVKPFDRYEQERATADRIWLTVAHGAKFYKGAEVMLFPDAWLERAHRIWLKLHGEIAVDVITGRDSGYRLEEAARRAGPRARVARAIGIDSAEGGDDSSWAAVDEWGLLDLVAYPTPDTDVITGDTIAFARKWGLIDHPNNWVFDRGGGGQQHVDRLIKMGYEGVRSIGFGEPVLMDLHHGMTRLEERQEHRAERYTYMNRRAQLYGEFRALLDPSTDASFLGFDIRSGPGKNWEGWGLPPTGYGTAYAELVRQLRPIPLLYDGEGRMRMMPKDKKDPRSKEKTLRELLGCSPDEADAVVLAVHGMLHEEIVATAGAAW
jgi:hypothetical protein